MPIYSFESEDGKEIEKFFKVNRAPKIGDAILVDGKSYRRVPHIYWGGFAKSQARKNTYPYLSNALPTTIRGCTLVADPKTGRMKPMIESARHERNVMAENDLVKGGNTFDIAD